MNSIQEKKKDDVHQSITFVARKCLEQLLNNCLWSVLDAKKKNQIGSLYILFCLFEWGRLPKTREKKSYKTKIATTILKHLDSPEKINKWIKKKLSVNPLSTASVSTKDLDCDLVAGRRFFLAGGIPFQIQDRQISFSWGRKGFEVQEAGWVYLCSYRGLFQAIKGIVRFIYSNSYLG